MLQSLFISHDNDKGRVSYGIYRRHFPSVTNIDTNCLRIFRVKNR